MRYKPGMSRAEKDRYNAYRRDVYKRNCAQAGVEYKPWNASQRTGGTTDIYPLNVRDNISDRVTARAKQLGIKRDDYIGSEQYIQDNEWIITGRPATNEFTASDAPIRTSVPDVLREEIRSQPQVDPIRAMLLQAAKQEELGIATPLLCRAQDAHIPLQILPTGANAIVAKMFEGMTLETFRQIAMKGE